MSKIILDFGSGNTCHNDIQYIKRMYDELKAVDTGKHEVIVKWQLFERAGNNIPLLPDSFEYAYDYGTSLGYQVTSSVFDKNSLDFLLSFDIPFVKIANNRKLDWLIGEVPRKIPVIVSWGRLDIAYEKPIPFNAKILLCISEYPAEIKQYEEAYVNLRQMTKFHHYGISDHTTNFGLWYRCEPEIIEMHYKLPNSTGPDAGPFARTPEQLAEVL